MKILKGSLNLQDFKPYDELIQIIADSDTDIRAICIKKSNMYMKLLKGNMDAIRGCAIDILIILRPLSKEEWDAIYPAVACNANPVILDYTKNGKFISE